MSIMVGSQTPTVSSGKLVEYPEFPSSYLGKRMVRVWLPEGYRTSEKYQVLYVHDGQMLWDAATTWNQQEWQLDEHLSLLQKTQKIKPTIVVAIDNAGKSRHAEYFPQKPFESLSLKKQDSLYALYRNPDQILFQGKIYSDHYLKFLTNELNPFIDQNYSTHRDASHTFIMGSSMGGLISMYALCEYPKVFGGALCLSTHWPGIFNSENNPIPEAFQHYLASHLPPPKNHKFYFDYGTETLDKMYEPYQLEVDQIMKSKGFTSKNWTTKKFPGADHSEKSWAARLSIPLELMLK